MAMKNCAFSRVQTLADSGIHTVPPEYVRWMEKTHCNPDRFQVTIIDLQLGLSTLQHDHFCKDHYDAVTAKFLRDAENWGFLHIINHGILDSLIVGVQAALSLYMKI